MICDLVRMEGSHVHDLQLTSGWGHAGFLCPAKQAPLYGQAFWKLMISFLGVVPGTFPAFPLETNRLFFHARIFILGFNEALHHLMSPLKLQFMLHKLLQGMLLFFWFTLRVRNIL